MKRPWLIWILSFGVGVSPCFSQDQKPQIDPKQVQKFLENKAAEKNEPSTTQQLLDKNPPAWNDILSIRDQLFKCWSSPPQKETITVDIAIKLKPNGMLDGKPEVRTEHKDELSKAVVASATKAIYACQPFKAPKSSYEIWKELDLRFVTKDDGPPIRRIPGSR